MSDIDRAAKAAYERNMEMYAASNPLPQHLEAIVKESSWAELPEPVKTHWREVAGAALAALSDPG